MSSPGASARHERARRGYAAACSRDASQADGNDKVFTSYVKTRLLPVLEVCLRKLYGDDPIAIGREQLATLLHMSSRNGLLLIDAWVDTAIVDLPTVSRADLAKIAYKYGFVSAKGKSGHVGGLDPSAYCAVAIWETLRLEFPDDDFRELAQSTISRLIVEAKYYSLVASELRTAVAQDRPLDFDDPLVAAFLVGADGHDDPVSPIKMSSQESYSRLGSRLRLWHLGISASFHEEGHSATVVAYVNRLHIAGPGRQEHGHGRHIARASPTRWVVPGA